MRNQLFFGDNLEILLQIPAESVDLVYLDPPFNSNAAYNILFIERDGTLPTAQIRAFEDTWKWDRGTERSYLSAIEGGNGSAAVLKSMVDVVGRTDLMAYLVMMAPRLAELQRTMKATASLYLHCDSGASHYLKILLDGVFGPKAFRAEIIWKRSSAHSDTKQGRRNYGRIHDVLLFYTKGEEWTWNPVYSPYDQEYVDAFYRHAEPETGRRYRLGDLTGPGGAAKGNPKYEVMGVTRYWRYSKKRMEELIRQGRVVQTKPGTVPAYKRYLDEMPGVPLQDVWTDIRPIGARAAERLGFQTQKPEALLERIIAVSSNVDDTVLDPFCGCGTAIAVAERLERHWIGIDITHHATNLIKHRLFDSFGGDCSEYDVIGEPVDEAGARVLAIGDRHAFQSWALGLVNARVTKGGKGPDRGVDGKLFFNDEPAGGRTKTIIFSVKSGRATVRDVRDLRGTVEREKAEIGVLLTLEPPTGPMQAEAVEAGFYQSPWGRYSRVQIITIRELLDGTGSIEYPQDPSRESTYRRAPRVRRLPAQGELDFTGRTVSRVPSKPRPSKAVDQPDEQRRASK